MCSANRVYLIMWYLQSFTVQYISVAASLQPTCGLSGSESEAVDRDSTSVNGPLLSASLSSSYHYSHMLSHSMTYMMIHGEHVVLE